MAGPRKRTGHCSLCDCEMFHVKSIDVVSGDPTALGAPHDHAWRVHLLLADGTMAAATLCAKCLPLAPARLPELWRRVMMAFAHEGGRRGSHHARPRLTPSQQEEQRAHLVALYSNVPVGILAAEKWSEVEA